MSTRGWLRSGGRFAKNLVVLSFLSASLLGGRGGAPRPLCFPCRFAPAPFGGRSLPPLGFASLRAAPVARRPSMRPRFGPLSGLVLVLGFGSLIPFFLLFRKRLRALPLRSAKRLGGVSFGVLRGLWPRPPLCAVRGDSHMGGGGADNARGHGFAAAVRTLWRGFTRPAASRRRLRSQ